MTGQLVSSFGDDHGVAPDGVWRAPGRVNLMGEHTDYNDGLVLPMALPWGVTAAFTPTDDGVVEVSSAQRPEDGTVRFRPASLDADRPSVPGWAAYVAGVFWALREAGHLADGTAGARIRVDSDLPVGAALSSSAALECAVLLAAAETFELGALAADRPAMARIARRAENAYVGAPTGIMDQSASLRCKEGHALYLDCRSEGGRNVALGLDDAGLRLLIIDTRVQHRLAAGGGYAQRRAECEKAAELLGVDALRDVEDLAAALETLGGDPVLRRRVKHIVTEIHRVNAAVGLLRAGQPGELGALFTASHLSMKDDFEISCPELDLAVETACRAGARGARMTGGGFGGSAVALIAEDRVDRVRDAVADAFAAKGLTAPEFRDAVPSQGAERLR
nr:galactokinase [Murinocardiopsis flavida]